MAGLELDDGEEGSLNFEQGIDEEEQELAAPASAGDDDDDDGGAWCHGGAGQVLSVSDDGDELGDDDVVGGVGGEHGVGVDRHATSLSHSMVGEGGMLLGSIQSDGEGDDGDEDGGVGGEGAPLESFDVSI